uniref:Uncharacterized protein n=1 Tax=Arundo donax TaxID=35708 RepID=A0A0A9DH91_ARUDO
MLVTVFYLLAFTQILPSILFLFKLSCHYLC